MCAQLGELDVHATAQAGSQVGGAGQHVAEMLVPHEAVVVLLEDLLNLEDREEEPTVNMSRVTQSKPEQNQHRDKVPRTRVKCK